MSTTSPVTSTGTNTSLIQQYNAAQSAAAASTTAATTSASSTATAGLNLDFSTYIKILTTQLQNQDPTAATDPNQFTQELVQLGGVQQQINTNTDLTALLNQGTSNSLATGAGYIGNYVAASSSTDAIALQSGSSEFGYTLASASASTTVTIQDSSGDTVAQFAGTTTNGANYVSWNGKDNNGTQLPDGSYTYSISAVDSGGNAISVSAPTVLAKVTGVQSNTDGSLQLLCGSLSVASSSVESLYTATSLPNSTALTAVNTSTTSSS